jgi:tetratricopeptide (TPR) repeat protein
LLIASDPYYASPPALAALRTKGELPLSDLRLKLYERARCRDPRNHFLLLDLAQEYGRHRRLAEADQMLRRLLELYPTSALIRSQAAAAYAAVGLTQRAIEHYRCSLRMAPDQPAAAAVRQELTRITAGLRQPIVV